MPQMTMAKALNAGLRSAMERDPKVVLMGEDIGKLGGVFRVTDGLQKDFGEARVFDTPLAESGIVGPAIGLAVRGYRPVCEIQSDGCVSHAYDRILIAYGPMVKTCLDVAGAADQSIEVIDLRSLSPLDFPTVFESVRRTKRAVVVHEASGFVGLGAEIAARLSEELYYEMEAPV